MKAVADAARTRPQVQGMVGLTVVDHRAQALCRALTSLPAFDTVLCECRVAAAGAAHLLFT